jgi:hypothetical protein
MTAVLDEELAGDATAETAYAALIDRLSRQSVAKHYDAYADIDWDGPDMAIDPADARWELTVDDPLGATAWYRCAPPDVRAAIGLERVVSAMKVGIEFENVLKRGLLEFAFELPNGAPEFRYVYHEVSEETHHGMMFQEFVNRSGVDAQGMPWHMRLGTRRVVGLARRFPALFFFFVLGGEDPIDFVQRRALRQGHAHPLLERIMRIHVTEEARHLSFARHYLKREVPRLGAVRRGLLSVAVPAMLGQMSRQMLGVAESVRKRYDVPETVDRAAYDSSESRQYRKDAVRKVRNLAAELGLVNPVSRRLWQVVGLWDEPAA